MNNAPPEKNYRALADELAQALRFLVDTETQMPGGKTHTLALDAARAVLERYGEIDRGAMVDELRLACERLLLSLAPFGEAVRYMRKVVDSIEEPAAKKRAQGATRGGS